MSKTFYKSFCFIAGLLISLAAPAEQSYEADQYTLHASKILPPELIKGPNHQVDEIVTNDGFLNTLSFIPAWVM